MTSKERISACCNGRKPDYIPLITQCFGYKPKKELTWEKKGKRLNHWYTMRLEHIHTLPQDWDIYDDFKRVLAWKSLGIDDIMDISVPWSIDPEVRWTDTVIPISKDNNSPIMIREYTTPAGNLRHAVKKTREEMRKGWVVQPDHVPLFEDYNIPRGVEHAVSKTEDITIIKHLYSSPDKEAEKWFDERMAQVGSFSGENDILVRAWSCFGIDAVIWLTGIEGAILMAMNNPEDFGKLVDIITETDYARAELACKNPAIDMIVQRGWYSGVDFWSPKLFEQFIYPGLVKIAELVHKYEKKFGYVITTGVEVMGELLRNSGIDVLFYIDPLQDSITLEKAKDMFCTEMTIVGGINSITLNSKNKTQIDNEVKRVINILGETNRFILQPVTSLFPDTPWEGVEMLIEAWNKYKYL